MAAVLLVGGGLAYMRLYDGHDLASQTRLVERACKQKVTLYSSTILEPHGPDSFKDSIRLAECTEIMEIHASDGRFGYAVFVQNEKGGSDLLVTNLYDKDAVVGRGFHGFGEQLYGIYQCSKPDLERLVLTITNDETGEAITEECEMAGHNICVVKLPDFRESTIQSTFYDVHGNKFE